MKRTKGWVRGVLLLVTLVAASVSEGRAASGADPREIMNQMYRNMTDGQRTLHMEMRVSDGAGSERVRELVVQSLRTPERRKNLVLIAAPAESRGTGFVTVEHEDLAKPSERWLFLPSVGRATRIATNQMATPFMGSDFSYGDMSQPNPEVFEVALENESVMADGETCWLLAAKPKSETTRSELGYDKLQIWVSKEKLVSVRIRAELTQAGKTKYIRASEFRKVGKYWVAHRLDARTVANGKVASQTVLRSRDVSTDDPNVTDAAFTKRRLEQGL